MINIQKNNNPKLHLPLILSIAIHIGILYWLISVAPVSTFRLQTPTPTPKPIVNAVAIDATKVAERVQNIQIREQQQQEKLRELKAQEQAARQAKLLEAQHLIQMKAEQQRAQQQREAAINQAKLEELHLAQLKEQQKALAVKQQQESEAKALAIKKQQEDEAKALAKKKQLEHEIELKELAEKKQRDLEAIKQRQAQLAEQQDDLQKKLLQQQIDNEKQLLVKAQQEREVIDHYRVQILMAIGKQWNIPDATDPTISCVFTIDLTPAGVVSHVQLTRSSGNIALDRAAEAAIYKASPLPIPTESSAAQSFRLFTIKMTPQDVSR